MVKTRFVGDVHGCVFELGLILENLPPDIDSVIQIGDMGVGFGQGNYWHDKLDALMCKNKAKFIRGNHDNPDICKTMNSWIPDGLIENDTMYVGGAWSIDFQYRTAGINWWKDEELNSIELQKMIDLYNLIRPAIMVTHDVPSSAAYELFFAFGKSHYGKNQYNTRTSSALDIMFRNHKPKLHLFGHWHQDIDQIVDGTRFICMNELSYCDVNMETLEVTFPSYQQKRFKS